VIVVENLHLKLPGFALKDINLRIESGDYFILVGPSASGKTVLLETIAGLHKVTSGRLWINDRDVTSLESEKRNIGMVYQDCALFPHLTVAENVIFGLRIRHKPASQIRRELDRVVQLFGISHLLTRKPDNLSGGEKQKVALARALATNPEVLLLDEPLAALDPQTRESVRQEIVRLHSNLGITIINVTHDFEEAVSMGTHIAVIGGGSIRQVGTPDEIFRHPNSEFVARFTMAVNVFPGVACRESDGTTVFTVEGVRLKVDAGITGICFAAIRPENIIISKSRTDDDRVNVFPAVITQIVNKGSIVNLTVDLPPALICLLTRHVFDEMNLTVGQRVYLTIPPPSVSLFRG
jgi:ABC-type Fe3+/spermidine/putrescine transport system ATPase subunit